MLSIVIFDKDKAIEYTPDAKLSDLTCLGEPAREAISTRIGERFNPAMLLALQINLAANDPITFAEGFRLMLAVAKPPHDTSGCFSTIGKNPIRIGNHVGDHIRIADSASSLAIYPGELHVLDGDDIYLNGQKAGVGVHAIAYGDALWVDAIKIIYHERYIECKGYGFTSLLNLSTQATAVPVDFPIYKRSPRIIKRTPTEEVELKPPPRKEKEKKGALLRVILPPLMTSGIMVGGSLLMGRGLFVLISAASMLVSVIFSATMFISERKEKRRKAAARDKAYDEYLLTKRKDIHNLYESQRESLLYHNLTPAQIEREVTTLSPRIYERAANDGDFLTLSLGYASTPLSFQLKYDTDAKLDAEEEDPLEVEMRELGGSYANIPHMPLVVDLKNAHLGLVGEKAYIHRQLTSIFMQLCFYQSYHDIEVITLLEEEYHERFAWVRWYPHCKIKNINVTGLVTAENHRDQALGNVAQVLKQRKQKQDEEKKEARFLPHYVFIIDNPKLIINHSIMEYLQAADTSLGFSLIYTTHLQANLPENVKTVMVLTGGDNATLVMEEGLLKNTQATLPSVAGIGVDGISRRLAPLIHNQGVSTQIPESVTFFELYNVQRPEELPIFELWQKNACHKSLAVPLGLRGKDDIVYLNLHEKAHGPHGLVAGTTGSGKSEIVQSYILSLAINFHPHEVGFLLIDYKGGGMANLFSDLPHLLGTITNLDGSESMRALASVKSELAKRQRIFNDHDVNNINQYTKLFKANEASIPMPHLFIISDEFAELKKEQPDFMAELVSTARIGRSLGVHLILATQKPSGVVDDQIWSNSKFKLALKVANESDSNEVLKTPDAARITQPGRSYLQVGNNEIYELFQSAYSGAAYSETVVEKGFDSRVYLINKLGQGDLLNEDLSEVDAAEDSRLSQLDVTVTQVKTLYDMLKSTPVDKPWLPPLASSIVTPHIHLGTDVGKIAAVNLTIPLGMIDLPEEQNQVEYVYDFTNDGNLAILAAPGFGKSTALTNMALTLCTTNSPLLMNLYILDFGNSALAQLRALPHVADYMTIDDDEKLGKLEKFLAEELQNRKRLFASVNAINFRMYNELAGEKEFEKLPAIIVFIDNADILKEASGNFEDNLAKIMRDGIGVGMYVVLSATRPSALRYTIMNNTKSKVAMYMYEPGDITASVGRSKYMISEAKGRAMVKPTSGEASVAQLYLPVAFDDGDEMDYVRKVGAAIDAINTANTATKAAGVKMLPDTITYADLEPYIATALESKTAIIGFDKETTEPLGLDLTIPIHLVVGAPTTGKTNVFKIILAHVLKNDDEDNNTILANEIQVQKTSDETLCFIVDGRTGDLSDYAETKGIIYMDNAEQLDLFHEKLQAELTRREEERAASGMKQREYVAAHPPMLVFIDDGDYFIELTKPMSTEMLALINKAKDIGFVFIIASLSSKLRGFGDMLTTLKDTQSGIVLGAPNDQSNALLPIAGFRGVKAIPNIGFWSKRGDDRRVMLPLME